MSIEEQKICLAEVSLHPCTNAGMQIQHYRFHSLQLSVELPDFDTWHFLARTCFLQAVINRTTTS